MRTVNVAELRSHLSTYLVRVGGGEEILIRDRTLAVAKIVPLSKTENYGDELLELAALGHLRFAGDEPRSKGLLRLADG